METTFYHIKIVGYNLYLIGSCPTLDGYTFHPNKYYTEKKGFKEGCWYNTKKQAEEVIENFKNIFKTDKINVEIVTSIRQISKSLP